MILMKARVRGHRLIRNSGWFPVGRKKTFIVSPQGRGKTALLRALETLNPAGGISSLNSYADYPRFREHEGSRRKVLPHKLTGSYGVFICDDEHRRELARIDPILYETDRIEAGRRLDLSRWISYVEISSSSRWSEIKEGLDTLYSRAVVPANTIPALGEAYSRFVHLADTDRIKSDTAARLSTFLKDLAPFLTDDLSSVLQDVRDRVGRAERFRKAKKCTEARLPPFFYFSRQHALPSITDWKDTLTSLDNPITAPSPSSMSLLECLAKGAFEKERNGNRGRDSFMDSKRQDPNELEKEINGFLKEHLQEMNGGIIITKGKKGLEITYPGMRGMAEAASFLAGLYVIVKAKLRRTDVPKIFCLDDPGRDFSSDGKRYLCRSFESLNRFGQLLIASTSPMESQDSDMDELLTIDVPTEEKGAVVRRIQSFDEVE